MHRALVKALVIVFLGGVGCQSSEPGVRLADAPLAPDIPSPTLDEVELAPVAPPESIELSLPPRPPPRAGIATVALEGDSPAFDDIRSITVSFDFTGVDGNVEAAAEFVGPNGLTYERQAVASAGTAFDNRTVRFNLPVAGTQITQTRLSGNWRVQLLVDGQPLTEQTFTLNP